MILRDKSPGSSLSWQEWCFIRVLQWLWENVTVSLGKPRERVSPNTMGSSWDSAQRLASNQLHLAASWKVDLGDLRCICLWFDEKNNGEERAEKITRKLWLAKHVWTSAPDPFKKLMCWECRSSSPVVANNIGRCPGRKENCSASILIPLSLEKRQILRQHKNEWEKGKKKKQKKAKL